MSIPKPVDPTLTDAWMALDKNADSFALNLRDAFDKDDERGPKWTFKAGDLIVDLSKNLVDEATLAQLFNLADQTGVLAHRDRMFAGERINATETRSVLHTALRRPETDTLVVDGEDVVVEVHKVLREVFDFADAVRVGTAVGVTGQKFKTIVNIGIGGSDLGPVMIYEALKPYVSKELECRFISNVDPTDVGEVVKDLDPETTLVVVTSKTFTTIETITNAKVVRNWFIDALKSRGVNVAEADAIAKHFVAVSTALDKVAEFGIDPKNAFGFWDWVGGRYSVDSAVGTSLAIALGPDTFARLLSGFHTMDEHFKTASPEKNVPLLMGLLNVWYTNFLGASTHAVLPYSQYLHRFPAYLQQLTMESNGKSVRWDGSPVTYDTGEVFWGEPGTNGQHAFYQLIHQGTLLIPADFIAFANPEYAFKDGDTDMHELLLSNFLAQTKALAFGKTVEEVRAEGTREEIIPARVFRGNRPTTSIMAPELSPEVLGQLVALYEHLTFVQGAVWGIDSFDQWGVELGKVLAREILPAVEGDADTLASQDSSTRTLIDFYLANRSK